LAADRFADDFTNPYARVGYAMSTMVCTPSSLSQPGRAALGAMAGEKRLRNVLDRAGMTRIDRVAREAAPMNIILAARAWRPHRLETTRIESLASTQPTRRRWYAGARSLQASS